MYGTTLMFGVEDVGETWPGCDVPAPFSRIDVREQDRVCDLSL
jgi:hypothetical protein